MLFFCVRKGESPVMLKSYVVVVAVFAICVLSFGWCMAQEPAASVAPVVEKAPEAAAAVPEAGAESVDALMVKWMELAKGATKEKSNIDECYEIAVKVAKRDKKALAPLLDMVGDPSVTPYTKIVATLSLAQGITPDMKTRLFEFVKSEQDATTRSCATELLGYIGKDDVKQVLVQLMSDGDRRVKFQALRAVVLRDPGRRKDMFEYWRKPDTTVAEKNSIVMVLTSMVVSSDCAWLLQDAAKDKALNEEVRLKAVQGLGFVGGQTALPVLGDVAKEENVKLQDAAKKAIESVEKRISRPVTEGGVPQEK